MNESRDMPDMPDMRDPPPMSPAPVVHWEQPACQLPNGQMRAAFSLTLQPGLSVLLGGEGRGKSHTLNAIAGVAGSTSGGPGRTQGLLISLESPADPSLDQLTVLAHLAARRACFVTWQADVEAALVGAWALAEHLHKPMFMLSTGSRRKVGLVAAAASGAPITLLDTPFAALDARSSRILCEVLAEAAQRRDRAWLLADYVLPSGLRGVPLMAVVNLGD
ncbi:ABC transporter ATP-binding protein [Ideonella sp.]|uniref:ABC transporter ATP-binding protein n=1 Tax=Ideonella sp. TaxID=1929293 RepID=UPI003BB543CC